MTLTLHAPNPIRVGETRNVLVTSDNPGVVSLTYGAGLTGPATVTIPGTRVYKIPNDNGAYLALQTSALSSRLGVTIVGKTSIDLMAKVPGAATNGQEFGPIIACINESVARRVNWGLLLNIYRTAATYAARIVYNQSADSGTNDLAYIGAGDGSITGEIRWAIVLPATGTTVPTYMTSRANLTNITRAATSGTMGGSEVVVLQAGQETAIFARELSNSDLDLWFAGTLPATPAAAWMGGHEIVESAPKIWDSAGTYDLGDYDVSGWQAANMRALMTDTAPVTPYALVPVAAVGTTGTTIDATRPRQGVPARASEAEKTETAAQITVTVEAPLVSIGPDTSATVASYPADIDLQVCATPDGTVSLASDDPLLTVPPTVVITGGRATVTAVASADVTGAIITATYGATTDTAAVTVAEVPEPEELLAIGPDTVADVESYPAAIILLLTSNVDGDVEITSDNENLIPMSPVTVIDGKAEVACLVTADVTGAIVTASRDPGPSDSCSVSVSDVLTGDWIAVGPNQRTRIEGKRIVWPIRVRSSKDGAFTATADPAAGIIVAGPFELVDGACDITAQPTQAGTWTLTVEQDGRTDSVTLQALPAATLPAVKQYNMSADIDGFFDFINRKYGLRPRFTAANVQDVRAEHSTDRTYSRYAQGTGQPGSVFGAVALSYQVMISYSSVTMAEQDLGILREEADRYGWNAIGFSMTGQTMFEPIKMMPRLTLTLNFDIIPQGR